MHKNSNPQKSRLIPLSAIMDKETKSIFENLFLAIKKELRLQLQIAIVEIEEERSIIGLDKKKFYEKKLKKLFKEYKDDLINYGKVVKYSKEDFINSYNNERDIPILKEEYNNARLKSSFVSERTQFYLKAEILEYLKQKAGEETSEKTQHEMTQETISGLKASKEIGADTITIEEKKGILTFKEACQFLSVKPPTLYKYTSQRLIPFIKKSKNIYFKREELEEWLEQGRKKTKSQVLEAINIKTKRY